MRNSINILLLVFWIVTMSNLHVLLGVKAGHMDNIEVGHEQTFEIPVILNHDADSTVSWSASVEMTSQYLQIVEVVENPHWIECGFLVLQNISPDSSELIIAAANAFSKTDSLAFTLRVKSKTTDVGYTAIIINTQSNEGQLVTQEVGVVIDESLPVELDQFRVTTSSDNHVMVNWNTVSEINASHFELYAVAHDWDSESGRWNTGQMFYMGRIEARNNPDGAVYSFRGQLPSGVYRVRMKQIDFDGQSEIYWSHVFDLGLNEIKLSAYPNPANPATTISLVLDQQRIVDIRIYNVLGQEVKKVFQDVAAGNLQIPVELTSLPSGVYFIQAVAGNVVTSTKLTVIK